jgi:hypothetical protein
VGGALIGAKRRKVMEERKRETAHRETEITSDQFHLVILSLT